MIEKFQNRDKTNFFKEKLSKPRADIKELSTIADLDLDVTTLSKKSIVAFDIDLTLVDYEDRVMSDFDKSTKYKFIKSILDAGGERLVELAFKQAKSRLIESSMLDLIKKLQALEGCKTIAFTARRTGRPQKITQDSIEDSTIALLNNLDIYFGNAFPNFDNVPLMDLIETPIPIQDTNNIPYEEPGPALFKKGILFSAGYEKESVLSGFFKLVGMPDEFILIDDKYEVLVQVLNLCAELGIKATGYHYTALAKSNNYSDPDIVECQYQSLVNDKVWLTDNEAIGLLELQRLARISI